MESPPQEQDPLRGTTGPIDRSNESSISLEIPPRKRGFVCQNKVPKEIVNCPECPAQFNYAGLLRSHILLEHKDLPSHTLFHCVYCEEDFTVRNAYYLHLQEKHPGEKLPNDIGCYCGTNFTRPENLNTHIVHFHANELRNGNKEFALSSYSAPEIVRYKCLICHSRFIRISSIVKHHKSIHSKEWASLKDEDKFLVENFLCSVCDMLFPLSGEGFTNHFKEAHPEFNFKKRQIQSPNTMVPAQSLIQANQNPTSEFVSIVHHTPQGQIHQLVPVTPTFFPVQVEQSPHVVHVSKKMKY